jgi:hypothetical protein
MTLDRDAGEAAASALRTTTAVRERAAALLARARAGQSAWFTVDDSALDSAALEVVAVTRERYSHLRIPYHSRWRHFEAGGVDRKALLDQQLDKQPGGAHPAERARAYIDLAVVSVLLDAGAGADWSYVEPATGQTFARSEGLGVASFHAFMAGMFSSDPARPLQADAAGLRGVVGDRLAEAFQVSPANPLVGVDGRLVLLRRLGEVLAEQPEVFGVDVPRPRRPVRHAGQALWHRHAAHGGGGGARHPVAGVDVAVFHLARAERFGHRAAGRLLAPQRRARPGPDGRVDALSQAVAMADLFIDRAV